MGTCVRYPEARNAIHVLNIMISSNKTRIKRAIVTEEPGGQRQNENSRNMYWLVRLTVCFGASGDSF